MRQAWGRYGLVPITLLYVVLFVAPVIAFLRNSFFESAGFGVIGAGPTLQNYVTIASDPYYGDLLSVTLEMALAASIVTMIISYPVATVIVRAPPFWGGIAFLVVLASTFTSAVVASLGLFVLLANFGPISSFARLFSPAGLPFQLANTPIAVTIGLVQTTTPLAILALIPAVEAVPRNLQAAADGLGASRWYTFWHVTFPLTRLAVIGTGLLTFAIAAGAFVTPLILGGGRVRTFSIEIRQVILNLLNYPLGAALATILLILTSVVIGVTLIVAGDRGLRGRSV